MSPTQSPNEFVSERFTTCEHATGSRKTRKHLAHCLFCLKLHKIKVLDCWRRFWLARFVPLRSYLSQEKYPHVSIIPAAASILSNSEFRCFQNNFFCWKGKNLDPANFRGSKRLFDFRLGGQKLWDQHTHTHSMVCRGHLTAEIV